MTSRQFLVMFLAGGLISGYALAEEAKTVDFCEVIQSPEQYDGKFVQILGTLSEWLRWEGDFYIDPLDCPFLLGIVTPDEVTPHPGFSLGEDKDWPFLVGGKLRDVPGYYVDARFEGRFDWVGVDIPPFPLKWNRNSDGSRIDWKSLRTKTGERVSKKDLYGKAKLPMRLVLRRVSDVRLVEIHRRHGSIRGGIALP